MTRLIYTRGGDHWWRLHGGVRSARAERETPRPRDRRDVTGIARASENVQDPTQTQRPAETQDRYPHRWDEMLVRVHMQFSQWRAVPKY